jgi:dephospho-CoA kinase
MLILGLTGSVGMGKSTAAGMFAEHGIPAFNADETVHALYRGAAVAPVEAAFPGVAEGGVIDRERLAKRVIGDPAAIAHLEKLVHPLVREVEAAFRAKAAHEGRRAILLDIPLLFETKGEHRVDVVIVVSAPAAIQRERVLSRPGASAERFEALLKRQLPDEEKRRRAHFIIDTSGPFEATRRQVADIIRAVGSIAAGR